MTSTLYNFGNDLFLVIMVMVKMIDVVVALLLVIIIVVLLLIVCLLVCGCIYFHTVKVVSNISSNCKIFQFHQLVSNNF